MIDCKRPTRWQAATLGRPPAFERRAFTLVEMLVTIGAIAILASMLLAGIFEAQSAARTHNTRALISKIDSQLKPRWESYRVRPLPISLKDAVDRINNKGLLGTTLDSNRPQDLAYAKLLAQREMMRMEMPCSWRDVTLAPQILPARTTVGQYMYDKWFGKSGKKDRTDEYQEAECLFLILTTTMPGGENARSLFKEGDFSDKDNDGLLEFVDAWGNVITYLRWAPGATRLPPDSGGKQSGYSDIQINDPITHHDPFDTRRVEPAAYAMYPLIFSAGPDGKTGIASAREDDAYGKAQLFPLASVESDIVVGRAWRSGDESLLDEDDQDQIDRAFDNIHNHSLGAR